VPEYTLRPGAQFVLNEKHTAAGTKANIIYKLEAKEIRKTVLLKRSPTVRVLIDQSSSGFSTWPTFLQQFGTLSSLFAFTSAS
jgi:hypothetical protein